MINRIVRALEERRAALEEGENEKGFTLIELIVVIIIIGILAAIAIPAFLNQRTAAWDASVKSDLANAAIAASTYAQDHSGSYANLTVAILEASPYNFKDTSGNTLKDGTAATSGSYQFTDSNSNAVNAGGAHKFTLNTGTISGPTT